MNEELETKKTVALAEPIITKLDKLFNDTNISKMTHPTFRKYTTTRPFVKTEFAYVSLVILDETYIPSVLVLGYTLRKFKCKYNLICMVQDKPEDKIINDEKKHFPGVSRQVIDDMLKVFDIVYGIDLLQLEVKESKNHFTKRISHYSNISLYVTKSHVFGLIDYKRVLFLDASVLTHTNIDYMFEEHKTNVFLWDSSVNKTNMGMRGSVFIITPSIRFYTKSLYLIKYYNKIFKDMYIKRGIDETILYFTVYPHWSKKLIKIWSSCPEYYKSKICPIYHYQVIKPFKPIPANTLNKERFTFQIWDKFAKELLVKIPLYEKYFHHIRKFRKVNY